MGTGNWELGTGNRELRTGNWGSAVGFVDPQVLLMKPRGPLRCVKQCSGAPAWLGVGVQEPVEASFEETTGG